MNVPAWRYYIKFYRGHYHELLLSVLVSIGQSLIILPIALLVRYAFDDLIPASDLDALILIGLAIALLYFVNGGATLWTRYVILKTTKIVIQHFRDEILNKFYTFSRSYYSEADRGKLHTSMVQDTERLDVMTNALFAQLVPALFISLALSALLVYLNWPLFLVMLCIMPILILLSKVIGRRAREKIQAFHRSFETFSRGMLFVLEVMDLTRIQSAEEFEIEKQRKNLQDLRLISRDMAWTMTAHVLAHNTIVAIAGVIILIAGGMAIAMGHMTLGELLSFYTTVALLKTHLHTISSCIPQIIEGNESLTTLYNLLESEDVRPYSGTQRMPFRGKITLASVSFRYKESPVLHDINLTIHPGTTVAIVGPNGSGKTTIANLILGFYRPQEGQLYADDCPFSELDIVHLRRHISVVTQNPIIFSGTIWDNITYSRPDANLEQVVQAAELATAHKFIQQLPQGYETFVGENGILLSGGQCQRIAIARALLRQPRLFILDEPTNHLDDEAVHRLMKNLKTLSDLPASIIISHNKNIVREAEHLYVLEEGRIVANGDVQGFSPKVNAAQRSPLNE